MRWAPSERRPNTVFSSALRAVAPAIVLFVALHLGLHSPQLGLGSSLEGAHAANEDIFQPDFAHWNIRGRYSRSGSTITADRYRTVYNFLFPGPQAEWPNNEGGDVEILMLQEASLLPHETNDPNWMPGFVDTEASWDSSTFSYAAGYDGTTQTGYRTMNAQIRVASWNIASGKIYYWYLLQVDTSTNNKLNLAIITDEPADRIIFVPPMFWETGTNSEGNRTLGPRPYLGVQFDSKYSKPVTFYTFHAKSGVDQNDLKPFFNALHAIHTDKSQLETAQDGTKVLASSHTAPENRANVRSWSLTSNNGSGGLNYTEDSNGAHTSTSVTRYVAAGDGNRDLTGEPAHANKRRKVGVNGKPQRLFYQDKKTHTSGGNLDYAITCGLNTRYTPRRSRVLNNPGDHWGVIYDGFTWFEWVTAAVNGLADPALLPAYSGAANPPRKEVHETLHGAHARADIIGLEGELDTVLNDTKNETKFYRAAALQAEKAISHNGTLYSGYEEEGSGLLYLGPGESSTLAKLDVEHGGLVVVDIRYAAYSAGTVKLYFVQPDGTESSETVTLSPTGGWGNWDHATVTLRTVAGVNDLKIDANQASFDLDAFDVAAVRPYYRGSEAIPTNTAAVFTTSTIRFGSTIGESARWINMANADGLSRKEYRIRYANGSSADVVVKVEVFNSKGTRIWHNSSVTLSPTGGWTTYTNHRLYYSSQPPLSGSVTMKMTLMSGEGPKISRVRIEPLSSKLHFHSATQRSNYGGHAGHAEFAIMRLNDTRWDGDQGKNTVTHTDHTTNNWWQGKLVDSRAIHKMVIHNRTDCCEDRLTDFHVFFASTDMSNGPGQPLTLDEAANRSDFSYFHPGSVGDSVPIDIGSQYSVPVEARYILIYKEENDYLSLGEVEAYGNHDEL